MTTKWEKIKRWFRYWMGDIPRIDIEKPDIIKLKRCHRNFSTKGKCKGRR